METSNYPKTGEGRAAAMQKKIGELQRANPNLSYDDAWVTANASPDMAEIVGAMQHPAAQTANGDVIDITHSAVWAAINAAEKVLHAHSNSSNETKRILAGHELFAPLYRYLGVHPEQTENSVAGAAAEHYRRITDERSANAANAAETTDAQGRSAMIQTELAKLMKDSGCTYDEAWDVLRKRPDTKAVIDAMEDPTKATHDAWGNKIDQWG